MICMMFYSHKKKELTAFRKIGGDIVCKISEEDWDMPLFDNKDEVLDFLSENPIIDISCVDVVAESGIEVAEKTRAGNKSAYICRKMIHIRNDNSYTVSEWLESFTAF